MVVNTHVFVIYCALLCSCWLDYENGLIWAFAGPAIVAILINFGFKIFSRKEKNSIQKQPEENKDQLEKIKATVQRRVAKGTSG